MVAERFVTREEINVNLSVVNDLIRRLIMMNSAINDNQAKLKALKLKHTLAQQLLAEKFNDYDIIIIDILADNVVYNLAIKQTINRLKTDFFAITDLAIAGKLSWLGQLNDQKVLWSWCLGESSVKFWRYPNQLFDERQSLQQSSC